MKRTDHAVAAVILLALALLTGCGKQETEPAATAPAPVAAAPAPEPPAEKEVEILSVLSVEQEVDILAQRDGVVVEIVREQGAPVEKGAVLARLDDREVQAELDRGRASLDVARNNALYNEAELKAKQAAYRRAREMQKERLISDADVEKAEFEAKGLGYDLESSRAAVMRAEAELRRFEVELDKTRIRAPFAGIVAHRSLRSGQTVLKDDKCFRVSALAPLQVRFLVPETAGRRPRAGDPVNVSPLGENERAYPARIISVSPVVDPASGSIEATARLTGSDLRDLRPGMAVRILWEIPAR